MKASCPYCGAEKHESKARAYKCGTCRSGSGSEYRTESCRITEAAVNAMNEAISQRDFAISEKDSAIHDKVMAEIDAKRDREFANEYHEQLELAMEAFCAEVVEKLKAAIA